jgi:hypothetical protein
MQELVRTMQAAHAAAVWYAGQRRKGAAGEPYFNHLIEVASLVTEATSGQDTNRTWSSRRFFMMPSRIRGSPLRPPLSVSVRTSPRLCWRLPTTKACRSRSGRIFR